jgi:hypothetical protein
MIYLSSKSQNSAAYDFVVLAHQPRTVRHTRLYCGIAPVYRRLMPYDRRNPDPLPVGGHYAVTRSLVRGLQRTGVRFAYNPHLPSTTARAAIVLCGLETLAQAIAWRRPAVARNCLPARTLRIPTKSPGHTDLMSPRVPT